MMSDVTNVRRAEEALAEHRNPDPIDRATVHASLAVSRAVRELDTTVRQGLRAIEKKIGAPEIGWLQWQDEDGFKSIPISDVNRIEQDGEFALIHTDDGIDRIPLSYAQALLQVGGA